VGLASQIPGYIAQLFFPDFSTGISSATETVVSNYAIYKSGFTFSDIPKLFDGVVISPESLSMLLIGIIILLLIQKTASVLQIAMVHGFRAEYFREKEKEYLQQ
jgi:hypothetical protein